MTLRHCLPPLYWYFIRFRVKYHPSLESPSIMTRLGSPRYWMELHFLQQWRHYEEESVLREHPAGTNSKSCSKCKHPLPGGGRELNWTCWKNFVSYRFFSRQGWHLFVRGGRESFTWSKWQTIFLLSQRRGQNLGLCPYLQMGKCTRIGPFHFLSVPPYGRHWNSNSRQNCWKDLNKIYYHSSFINAFLLCGPEN